MFRRSLAEFLYVMINSLLDAKQSTGRVYSFSAHEI
jgi:hypothetical protein